ncbi:MAG: hypothetical protein J7K54_03115 [Candidatus Aenigmarchaeota archaeon]|nr:hypothetical protein [Candidatus Aenigmarchaeota archaeon]
MIIGIDIGGTNTQGVLFERGKLKAKRSVEGNKLKHALECYRFLEKKASGRCRVVLTGGGSRKIRKRDFPVPFRKVGEIQALGKGGQYLSGRGSIFVVSIGTGTAFVSVKNGRARHLGGTGVGGGTFYGLSKLLIGRDPDSTERMARRGTGKHDLTVGDIVGSGIGRIPAKATASNFGRASASYGKKELAHSTLKMIGETIGVMSYFAAKTVGQEKNIMLCGRVSLNPLVKKFIRDTAKLMGAKAEFPENAEYCAAIGAALL